MANRTIKKVKINKDLFLKTIKEKGYSLSSLGKEPKIDRCEKTLYRCLKAREMSLDLLIRIAKFLDVDINLLVQKDQKAQVLQENLIYLAECLGKKEDLSEWEIKALTRLVDAIDKIVR